MLLVSLGLIDLGFYTKAEQTADNVRRFVAQARAAHSRVRMVLLPVIPNVRAESDAPFAAEVARFNELLAKAVADLSTDASPILLAARPQAYDIHRDTYDGTHPNASGEHRLAGSSPRCCTRRGASAAPTGACNTPFTRGLAWSALQAVGW